MKLFNKSRDNSKDDNVYLGLRQQILNLKPESFEDQMEQMGFDIYAAVVDMDMGTAVVTLACVIDGTTSLYYSNGGGLLGSGQKYEVVRNATFAFLHSAEQVVNMLAPAKDYDLPKEHKHSVYLLTKQGVFKEEYDMNQISNYSREKQFLNFLYQNVLKVLGENTRH